MAINILGKFLTNRDNNIRYVALNTLNKVVSMDTNAVQRHRNTILDCLRDGDISIRRRALELSYALVNEGNVRVMTRELLSFLEVADNEFKLGMTTQITLGAERFAPNKRWQIDTVLRVLTLVSTILRPSLTPGWKLCPRGNSGIIHPPGLPYTRTPVLHCSAAVQRPLCRLVPGFAYSRCGLGDRRVCGCALARRNDGRGRRGEASGLCAVAVC